MKIVVVGLGYVGLANAVLLAQHNEVIGVDICSEKVDLVNARKSTIIDKEVSDYFQNRDLRLKASTDLNLSVRNANYVIISTPTNYDEKKEEFDTSTVEETIEKIICSEPDACIVVKSTIPIGFIDRAKKYFGIENMFFSPEFLREGSALHDNLYPSRIVIGDHSEKAKIFAELIKQGSILKNVELLFTGTREAEAIKLFANSYLAMRVAFFNELDSFSLGLDLNVKQIIDGVSLDKRIGRHYNNPSFGYGGYCLPKDTKQLLANFNTVPQNLIKAIIDSNMTRKKFLAKQISSYSPKIVGVYRLAMKFGSDNFRYSSIQDIMGMLDNFGHEIIIYEPNLNTKKFGKFHVENNLDAFKMDSDVIIANRLFKELADVSDKIFLA